MSYKWRWIQSEKINGWYIMSGMGATGGWWAWGKRTPIISRDGPLDEPDLYAEFGESRKESISRLFKSDLDNLDV